MKEVVGVCLGASTVSFVRASLGDAGRITILDVFTEAHNGNPKDFFLDNLKIFNPDMLPVVVTGRKFRNLVKLTSIPEPEATELAFSCLYDNLSDFSAIASLGGETFMVYTIDDEGKISNVITKNQCASGTGEFFLQQIKRMNLGVEEVVDIAATSDPYRVSGRCSVFCKSDCTHALNKGVPKGEVAAGLSQMMSEKVVELLKKVRHGKVLVVGGVTKNHMVMEYMRNEIPDMIIPGESTYFEAFGAAIYGLNKDLPKLESINKIMQEKESSFVFHEPLVAAKDKVTFKQFEKGHAIEGDECILGLDVGSTTTKAVVIRKSDDKMLGSIYLYTHGNPIAASKKCYQALLEQIPEKINIIGIGVTGSGRHIAGLHALTEGVINEIVAHATAAVYFDEEVDTIFEIGGQDAKYTYIVNKVPADYAMNEACSAGTGSFIEESAYESLGIKVTDIEPIAMKGTRPPNFSDQCSAFISSDIKTALQEDISREDIVAGLVYSICMNYVNRVKGNRPVGKKIFMQGGVCYNKAIPIAMAALTGNEIIVPPEPGLMGAFGVALEVKEKIALGILQPTFYDLSELAVRDVEYKDPFICRGGKEKCDLKCSINIIEIEGKKYPFGGACNKYYSLNKQKRIDVEKYDYVKKRQDLIFGKYAPDYNLPADAPTVGINLSFHAHTIYPLYHYFFSELGLRIVLPENINEEALEREMTSFCFPAQVSLCLFHDLIERNPDYIFMPSLIEMHVNEEDHHVLEHNSTCVFVLGEPHYIKQAYKDYNMLDRFIHPTLNFASGFDAEEKQFIEVAAKMGVKDEGKIRKAYKLAVQKQTEFIDEMFTYGQEILKYLSENPDEMAMVLVGRPYNSFTNDTNKGIPQKYASRGVYVIPYDMFDYRQEELINQMFWEGGKKILKIGQIIKHNPQLFATYISNFSCGPDSMLITQFRKIMGTKPSLTLELDSHSADAGVNTRIDAALDIINNYRKISGRITDPDLTAYSPARIAFEETVGYFYTSAGERVPLKDPRVTIIIPSMADLSTELFAAGLRSLGFNAIAAPKSNPEILKYARANATGKECLPVLLLAGTMIDYVKNNQKEGELVAFFNVQGAGNCRLGQYPVFLKHVIDMNKFKDLANLVLINEEGFAGFGPDFAKIGIRTIIAADVLDDVRSGILANAIDPIEGEAIFNEEFKKLIEVTESRPEKFYKTLNIFAENLRNKIPARIPISESKYIALVGEMYVRREHFAHKSLNRQLAKKGFIVNIAYLSEWIFYVDYLLKLDLLEPNKSLKNKIEREVRMAYMRNAERKIKRILDRSGYYEFRKTDVKSLIDHSKHILPIDYKGEPGLTLGVALHETIEHYSGVINLGPFGCMPTRVAEAITMPEMKIENKIHAEKMHKHNYTLPEEIFNGKMNIPFLTIETDGNVFPQVIEARLETFALQADRVATKIKQYREKMKKKGMFHKNGTHKNGNGTSQEQVHKLDYNFIEDKNKVK
jgi:predicted CoA-substrate-specific enzyme activase